MTVPLVSVVMPAFDVAGFVADAVRSVHAQTWPRLELVAVDDGSSDGTGDRLAALAVEWRGEGRRMQVVRQSNRGVAAARNAGLSRTGGRYVAFLDADDVCHPRLVQALVTELEADPELDLAFALYRYVDEAGRATSTQPAPRRRLTTFDLLCDNIAHAPVLRSDVLGAVGGFDEALTAHVDLDLLVRITERRPASVGCVAEPLSDYRRRGHQITSDWRRMRRNWRRVRRKLEDGGFALGRREERTMGARLRLYWAHLAYQGGDYAAARRLLAEAWRLHPPAVAGDRQGWLRSAACLASLLPDRAHDGLRVWFNRRPG